MDVFECVSTLSSIRSYIEKEVPDEIVLKVLEAGRLFSCTMCKKFRTPY